MTAARACSTLSRTPINLYTTCYLHYQRYNFIHVQYSFEALIKKYSPQTIAILKKTKFTEIQSDTTDEKIVI